jgi:hypothetical protein
MPAIEFYSNGAVTTVHTAIDAVSTTLVVETDANFPSLGNFHIKVDSEIMVVTAVSGTSPSTWTVTRGAESTAAAVHSSGTFVFNIFSKEALEGLVVELHQGTVVQSRRRLNFVDTASLVWTLTDDPTNQKMDITAVASGGGGGAGINGYESAFTAPVLGDFTWVNQGAGTVTSSSHGLFLRAPATASNNMRLLNVNAPATPYTVTARFAPSIVGENYAAVGLHWYDTVSGKVVPFRFSTNKIQVQKYSAPGTFAATYQEVLAEGSTHFPWLRIADDGTNRVCSMSIDGTNWIVFHTVGNTDYMTANRVGWNAEANNGTYDAAVLLLSWALG